jgi:peptidoglycan/xylan/chitin deacetylase (PgdA/CDA1 family)
VTAWVCLLYHGVPAEAPAGGGGPDRFAVARADFERQLAWLADDGWTGRSVAACLNDPRPRQVALSFDDGEYNQFASALPALVARGMTATFYVTTSWVGRPGYVSWDDLRTMRDAGMDIQSHTHTHPFLRDLASPEVSFELTESRRQLDRELEQQTNGLSFPNGSYPRSECRRLVEDAGYQVVGTSRWGANHGTARTGPTYVRRCTISGAPSQRLFLQVVSGDAALRWRKQSREWCLGSLRAVLGSDRYSRWRRRLLDAAQG